MFVWSLKYICISHIYVCMRGSNARGCDCERVCDIFKYLSRPSSKHAGRGRGEEASDVTLPTLRELGLTPIKRQSRNEKISLYSSWLLPTALASIRTRSAWDVFLLEHLGEGVNDCFRPSQQPISSDLASLPVSLSCVCG